MHRIVYMGHSNLSEDWIFWFYLAHFAWKSFMKNSCCCCIMGSHKERTICYNRSLLIDLSKWKENMWKWEGQGEEVPHGCLKFGLTIHGSSWRQMMNCRISLCDTSDKTLQTKQTATRRQPAVLLKSWYSFIPPLVSLTNIS